MWNKPSFKIIEEDARDIYIPIKTKKSLKDF